MRDHRMRAGLCLLLSIVVPLAGCTPPGPRTYPVSGTVTFDGRPVSEGDIIFVPEDPSLGPDAGKIESGRFATRAKEGKCRVEITALNVGPATPIVMGSPIAENFIPERYNRASQLTVVVSASGDNEFTFELESEPGDP